MAARRVPVVEERGVLAAVDRPEEGVADRLAPQRRRAVGGDQEPGRPVLLVDRIVDDRRVEERHALHLEHRVARERVVVERDRRAVGDDLPPRRGLHAGREPALLDAVLVGAQLVQLGAPEHRDRLLRAEQAAVRLLRHVGGAERVVEHAGSRLRVERHPVGVDLRLGRRERDVAPGLDQVGVGVDVHLVREELVLVADDLDVAREPDVVLADLVGRLAQAVPVHAARERILGGRRGGVQEGSAEEAVEQEEA